MIRTVLAYTNPVYKHLFILPDSCLNQRISFMQILLVLQFTYERWYSSYSDKQTNKQKQGQLLTQLLYSFLGDPTGLVTIHVSAWLHLCSGRTTHWSLSHWVLREEQPNHSHMSCQHDRLSEGSLHLLQSRVKRLSFYLISLGLHILRSPRALTPWTMRPFSSSVKSIWDLEEQSTPPSLASSTEKEREGRRDTCLQVIRM